MRACTTPRAHTQYHVKMKESKKKSEINEKKPLLVRGEYYSRDKAPLEDGAFFISTVKYTDGKYRNGYYTQNKPLKKI